MQLLRRWIDEHVDLAQVWNLFLYDPTEPLLFNSGFFLFLFIAFLGIYILLEKNKPLRILYVTAFSLFFYYKTSGIYVWILLFSTVVDFGLGWAIHKAKTKFSRTFFLFLSLLANLGLLAYFKYTFFILDTISLFTEGSYDTFDIFLPVGISFYTFQTMSYSIDIFRNKITPLKNPIDFAFFVSFFPQLVAGPIVRAADFIPQINKKLRVSREDLGRGLLLICGGLFKKAVISDYIGVNFVDRIFDEPALYSGLENLLGVYAYALQIYCDFSGYSDMAIGIALLMGFRLPPNFNAPYKARSLRDFWRRWHISLSTWLRDYLYISLGGSRKGKFRTYINLMITMLLGGLWHGANWKFVFWGFMHGMMLALERVIKDLQQFLRIYVPKLDHFITNNYLESNISSQRTFGKAYAKAGNFYWKIRIGLEPTLKIARPIIGLIFTFHFVCFCWIFFRATNFQSGLDIINRITTSFNAELLPQIIQGYPYVWLLCILGYILHFIPDSFEITITRRFTLAPAWIKSFALAIIIWLVIQTRQADIQPFIYFQF